MSSINPICPTSCISTIPAVSFDLCSPLLSFGEIHTLFIASGDASPFNDWEDVTEWINRLDNSDVSDIDKIRKLTVIGDMPVASSDDIPISKRRTIKSPATYVLNIDIDDYTQPNYEMARTTSCNVQFRVWFANDLFMFGGNDGILANINFRPMIERGVKSINKLSGTITWESQFAPERASYVGNIDIDKTYKISGYLRYNKTAVLGLGGANYTVYLKDGLEPTPPAIAPVPNILYSAIPDANGYFEFNVGIGTYYLFASSTAAWAGVVATDATQLQRYNASLSNTLTGNALRIKSADINQDGVVDNDDVSPLQLKIANTPDGNFKIAEWSFENIELNVINANITQNLLGMCSGDFTGSYPNP